MVGYPLNNRPIKNARRDNTVSTILDGHRSYDALQYSIKFWQGQKEHHIRKCDPNTGKFYIIHLIYIKKKLLISSL